MKSRHGFVSNSSSTSFVLKKDNMSDDEINAFRDERDYNADIHDDIGETDNFFFGFIDYNGEFYVWLENKNFKDIEWSG